MCSPSLVLRSSWHAGYRRLCHLAGISRHENIVPAVHCARHCGGYLVATLILSSLNPRSRMERHQVLCKSVRLCIHTQETPRGEVFPGGWEGGAFLCKGSELCLGGYQSSKQQTFPLCHQQPLSCCAGLLGANFAQILLNAGKFDDPIARGLSTSGAAHGLGTAAMAAT